jgi:hypothetical protein
MPSVSSAQRLQEKLDGYYRIDEGDHPCATLMRAALDAGANVQDAVLQEVEERESASSSETRGMQQIGRELSASNAAPQLVGEITLRPFPLGPAATPKDVRDAVGGAASVWRAHWAFRREQVDSMRILLKPGAFDPRVLEAFGQLARGEHAAHMNVGLSIAASRDARGALLAAAADRSRSK